MLSRTAGLWSGRKNYNLEFVLPNKSRSFGTWFWVVCTTLDKTGCKSTPRSFMEQYQVQHEPFTPRPKGQNANEKCQQIISEMYSLHTRKLETCTCTSLKPSKCLDEQAGTGNAKRLVHLHSSEERQPPHTGAGTKHQRTDRRRRSAGRNSPVPPCLT